MELEHDETINVWSTLDKLSSQEGKAAVILMYLWKVDLSKGSQMVTISLAV